MNEQIKAKIIEIIDKNKRLQDYSIDEDYAEDFVEIAETVEDFKNNAYAWSNSPLEPSDAGDGVFHLQNHKYQKGDTRGDLFIIDLGEKRYAYKMC